MPTDKFIIALDFDTKKEALEMVRLLKSEVTFFKVGLQLFVREGPDFVRELRREKIDIFLDLKLHDIPNTVAQAVKAMRDLEVRFLTIHTTGGGAMLKAAQEMVDGSSTTLLGVTVMTSLDEKTLHEVGVDQSVQDQVVRLAKLSAANELGGLIISPLEIELLRKELGQKVKLVTPGIRGANDKMGDQKRTLSAMEALQRGADHLVIGRPVTQAANPLEAVQLLRKECGL